MEALEAWFRQHGGYLHASTHLAKDEEYGVHLVTATDIEPDTNIVTAPHTVALSSLNALVDDGYPVFKNNTNAFSVDALSYFYLITQYLNKEKSFWKPYLETLPSPEEGFDTPNFFDEEDLKWLEGTDLQNTFISRREKWQKDWQQGLAVLKKHGMNSEAYTWDLYKWAATVFTSRAFGSRSLHPQESKYWAAYKTTATSARATVLLDLSHLPTERKEFPVLFPVLDILNHSPLAPVEWTFAPSRFELKLLSPCPAGSQVYNNYGPKSTAELLMGYGFCPLHNPHDNVLETLKPPPAPLQTCLRTTHPGYFRTDTSWNSEAATFPLTRPGSNDIWASVPDALVELFYYLARFERGLEFNPIDASEGTIHDYLFRGRGAQYLPRIAFMIVSSLVPKMQKLDAAGRGLGAPRGRRQECAAVYRAGQAEIMAALREGLGAWNRALRPTVGGKRRGALWSLEEVVGCMDQAEEFLTGVGVEATQLVELRGGDVEVRLWVLWVCFVSILHSRNVGDAVVVDWVKALTGEYGDPFDEEVGGHDEEEEEEAEAAPFLDVVRHAAEGVGGDSVWKSEKWTTGLVLDWGLRVVRSQGMLMKVGEVDVRYVVYLHID